MKVRNEFTLSSSVTRLSLTTIVAATVLPETPELFLKWRDLVLTYEVSGAKVHDARLVAAMRVYGVKHILTFNHKDFARYVDVEAVHV